MRNNMKRVTRKVALEISRGILERAERERLEQADRESRVGLTWKDDDWLIEK